MKKYVYALLILLVIGAIIFAVMRRQYLMSRASTEPIADVSYMCNAGKTIEAKYYQGESKPSPGPDQPPIPGGSVSVALSDGRSYHLSQTISADGIRYANADEAFVFWSMGNGALVLENDQEKSYIGCIKVVDNPGGLPQVYESGSQGFSLRYPPDYTVDESYRYQEFGPDHEIAGVKFTIPSSVTEGTNLASDSYFSIEQIPQASACTADRLLDRGPREKATTISDSGTDYSFASTTGAGAGNRYEETVYALPGTNPCIAVRYFIHYGVIENYPPGAVKQFDEAALKAQFDAIRRTLTII